jgi:Ala-tRNA(Pro) deacylase
MEQFIVEKTLHHGRPEGPHEEKETRCYDLLDRLKIDYEMVRHSPADSVEKCMEVEKVIGVSICKNLFLCNRQRTSFYLLMMPGLKPFNTSLFSKLVGSSRLSFGSEAHMLEYLDISPGSVSILGLMNDKEKRVRLAVDLDVIREDYIRCHPCVNTSTLRMRTRDVLDTLLPAIGHEPVFVELPWRV